MAKQLAKSRLFISMVGLFMVLSMVGVAGIITPLFAATTVNVTNNITSDTEGGAFGLLMDFELSSADGDTLNSMELTLTGTGTFDPSVDFGDFPNDDSAPPFMLATTENPNEVADLVLMATRDAITGSGPWTVTLSPIGDPVTIPSSPTTYYLLYGLGDDFEQENAMKIGIASDGITTSLGNPSVSPTETAWITLVDDGGYCAAIIGETTSADLNVSLDLAINDNNDAYDDYDYLAGTYLRDGTYDSNPVFHYNNGSNDYYIFWSEDEWGLSTSIGGEPIVFNDGFDGDPSPEEVDINSIITNEWYIGVSECQEGDNNCYCDDGGCGASIGSTTSSDLNVSLNLAINDNNDAYGDYDYLAGVYARDGTQNSNPVFHYNNGSNDYYIFWSDGEWMLSDALDGHGVMYLGVDGDPSPEEVDINSILGDGWVVEVNECQEGDDNCYCDDGDDGDDPTNLTQYLISEIADDTVSQLSNAKIGQFTLNGSGYLSNFKGTIFPYNGYNLGEDFSTVYVTTRELSEFENFDGLNESEVAVYMCDTPQDNGDGSYQIELSCGQGGGYFSGEKTFYVYTKSNISADVNSYFDFGYVADDISFGDDQSVAALGFSGGDTVRITLEDFETPTTITKNITAHAGGTVNAGEVVQLFRIDLQGDVGIDILNEIDLSLLTENTFNPNVSFPEFINAGAGKGLLASTEGNLAGKTDPDDVGMSISYSHSSYEMLGSGPYSMTLGSNSSDLIPADPEEYSIYIYAFIAEIAPAGESFTVSLVNLDTIGNGDILDTPITTSTITVVEPEESSFALIAYGPEDGSTVPRFASVDFMFNDDIADAMLPTLDSYFSVSPSIDGSWDWFTEYWGENEVTRISFMPENGFEEGVTYTIKASKSLTNKSSDELTIDLGQADDAGFYNAIDSDSTHYYFTVVGGDDDFGGKFPPLAWAGYPYEEMKQVSTGLSSLSINFDRDFMDAETFSTGSIYLQKEVDGEFETVNGISVHPTEGQTNNAFIEDFNLDSNSRYRVVVTRDVKDMEGTPIVGMYTDFNDEPGPYYYDFYTGSSSENIEAEFMGTNLDAYDEIDEVFQDFPQYDTVFLSFNNPLNPALVNTTNFTISPALNCEGDDYSALYNPDSFEVFVVPHCSYQAETEYTLSWQNLASISGVSIDNDSLTYKIDSTDGSQPHVQNVRADNYGLIIEFSEPVLADKVKNKGNYTLKTRDDSTDWASVSADSLANASLSYDSGMAVGYIDIALDPGEEFQLTVSNNITDGAGNVLLTTGGANVLSGYVMDASNFAGGAGFKGMESFSSFDMGDMGESPINVNPASSFVGQETQYFIDIPINRQIDAGGKIEITMPVGFDVTEVVKLEGSPVNDDINGPGQGIVGFATTDPSGTLSNDVLNDGIGVIGERTIVIQLNQATQVNDYLTIDLDQIENSSVVKGPDTSGWQAEIFTYNSTGQLLEGMISLPFFTNGEGDGEINVTINGVADGDSGDMTVVLKSPMTGKIQESVTLTGNVGATNNGTVTFEDLPSGDYQLFTSSSVDLGTMYFGYDSPEIIWLDGNTVNKTITLESQESSDSKYPLEVNLIGDFRSDGEADDIDIFAGSPNGFRRITVTPGNTGGENYTMYLPDGDWSIGIGPAIPENFWGVVEMPDWPEPAQQFVSIWDNGSSTTTGAITFNISDAASYTISGYVYDDQGQGIANVEVYAYSPMGGFGERRAKTDSAGQYSMIVNWPGVYTLGAWKEGFPEAKEKSVEVNDDNQSASVDLKMKKPEYTISGTVKNFDGVAVPYAPVWTYETNGNYGWAGTSTDVNGKYILYVDSGTWMIETDPQGVGWMQYSEAITVSDDDISGIVLEPDANAEYYDIAGTITVDGSVRSFTPLRAVQYNSDGEYTGLEYGGSTDSEGNYLLTVPGDAYYRVDTWLAGYGEIAASPDEVANNPATTIIADADRSGIDITMGSSELTEVSIVFSNYDEEAYEEVEAFVNFEGFDPNTGLPTDYHNSKVISDVSNNSGEHTIKVKDGNYHVFVHLPGFGEYIPVEGMYNAENTPGYIDIGDSSTDNNQVTIPLPAMSDLVEVVGSVVDGSDAPISDAWVWIGNPANGYHRGTTTDSAGEFSFDVPKISSGNYDIGADKPGYMSVTPQQVDLTDENEDGEADMAYDMELLSQSATISGYIYRDIDGGTANEYDSGEAVSNGWVFAVDSSGNVAHAPVDGSGYYELGVVDGVWAVYGQGDGYDESLYTVDGVETYLTVAGSSLTDKHIKLSTRDNWTKKTKKGSITPAQGGTIDDTDSDGTGVKVTMPANALGDDNTAGSVNISNTTAVARSNSNAPLGNEGRVISITDANGQPITTLNDYIDLELVVWKSEIDAEIEAGRLDDYNDLLSAKLGYFDNSTNDWVSLETTRTAYYKTELSQTEWLTYSSDVTDRSNFQDFVYDVLIDGSVSVVDYKLVFTAKTDHLTTFSVTTSIAASSTPSSDSPARTNVDTETAAIVIAPAEITVDETRTIDISTVESLITLTSSGSMHFALGSEGHSVTLSNVDITGNNATFLIASEPKIVEIRINETKEVDVNDDGENDIQIKLNEIVNGSQVKFSVSLISPDSEESAENIESGDPVVEEVEEKEDVLTNYFPTKNPVRSLEAEIAAIKEVAPMLGFLPKANVEWQLVDFLAYGSTDQTKAMSSRERKGLLEDFKVIYNRLPIGELDWKSLADISSGVTPSRVLSREAAAIKEFVNVFNRNVDFSKAEDEAFVHQLAYRLRPQERSLDTEKSAIQKFIQVYRSAPKTGYAWAIMRAIAYSGAIEKDVPVDVSQSNENVIPELPKNRNLITEMDAVKKYISLTGKVPTGTNWQIVHFVAYGNTDSSKTMTSFQRYETLRDYKYQYGKLPKIEKDWNNLVELMK